MNPLTVKLWSQPQGVIQRFIDMGLTSGTSCGMAEAIFGKMNEVCFDVGFFVSPLAFIKHGLSWGLGIFHNEYFLGAEWARDPLEQLCGPCC